MDSDIIELEPCIVSEAIESEGILLKYLKQVISIIKKLLNKFIINKGL